MRWSGYVATVAGIALLLVGPATPTGGQTLLRVGTVGSVSDAGFFIALEKGYFAGQGLSVEFLPFRSAAVRISAATMKT